MPTQNRRVATYLPPHIDEPFKAFKSQRDIKGDSEALIAILSEYLQVSQEVAYPSSSNLLQRIEAIEDRLSNLKGELLSELKSELQQPKVENQNSKLFNSLQGELPVSNNPKSTEKRTCRSGSLGLPSEYSVPADSRSYGLKSELLSSSSKLRPMSQTDLAARLQLKNERSLGNKKSMYKDEPERFAEWSKSRDPDSVAWEHHEDDRLYHPVQPT